MTSRVGFDEFSFIQFRISIVIITTVEFVYFGGEAHLKKRQSLHYKPIEQMI